MAITSFKGQFEFLSNMYPIGFYYNSEFYPSVEHAFQAMKCLDKKDRIAISVCRSAKEAKEAGRLVQLRSDWEQVKLSVMKDILKAKFSDPVMASKLLNTGSEELIEGNSWGDTYWGVCRGQGQNNLGKILMSIRDELQ